MFVVGQVGVDTQVDCKQAAMQLSLRKDNLQSQLDRQPVQTCEIGAYVIIGSG